MLDILLHTLRLVYPGLLAEYPGLQLQDTRDGEFFNNFPSENESEVSDIEYQDDSEPE